MNSARAWAEAAGDAVRGRLSRAGARAVGWALLGWAASATLAGCAKNPTVVVTEVSVGADVPALLQLRATIASATNPSLTVSSSFSSLFKGDAADRPAPYVFPLRLSLNVPPEMEGDVVITVEGLEWITNVVVAKGSGPGQVMKQKTTMATVTLAPFSGGVPDGGGDGGDAGSGQDADGGVGDAAAEMGAEAGAEAGVEAGADGGVPDAAPDLPPEAGPGDAADEAGAPDVAPEAGSEAGPPDAGEETAEDAAEDAMLADAASETDDAATGE